MVRLVAFSSHLIMILTRRPFSTTTTTKQNNTFIFDPLFYYIIPTLSRLHPRVNALHICFHDSRQKKIKTNVPPILTTDVDYITTSANCTITTACLHAK